MERSKKFNGWMVLFGFLVLSVISGVVLACVSQLGDRYNISVINQIRANNPPILTFIGEGLMIIPMIIAIVSVYIKQRIEKKRNAKV